MIPRDQFIANIDVIVQHLSNPALDGGAIVECGTWRGGMSATMVELGGSERHYYFFDSFEGLPPAQEKDGQFARTYQQEPGYHNCKASIEEFSETVSKANGSARHIHVFKGWFDKTFPQITPPPLAALRLDADWYDSTMLCLEKFWGSLLPEGLLLIDDYYVWEGCRRAVHDFLSKHRLAEPIFQGHGFAYITKGPKREAGS